MLTQRIILPLLVAVAGAGLGLWTMATPAYGGIVASEPLTRDVSTWVEVPEYSMLHAVIRRNQQPAVTLRELS